MCFFLPNVIVGASETTPHIEPPGPKVSSSLIQRWLALKHKVASIHLSRSLAQPLIYLGIIHCIMVVVIVYAELIEVLIREQGRDVVLD